MLRPTRQRSVITRVLGARAARSSAAAGRLAPVPIALWALLPLNALALVSSLTVLSSPYPAELGSLLLAAMATLNAALGAAVAYRLRGYEVRSNQREHVRLLVDFDATLDGVAVRVLDVSLGGALVVFPSERERQLGGDQQLDFTMRGVPLRFITTPARIDQDGASAEVALRFRPGQDEMIARLGVALLTEVDRDEALATDTDSYRVAA